MAPFGGILAWLPLQDACSTVKILGFGSNFCLPWLSLGLAPYFADAPIPASLSASLAGDESEYLCFYDW
jgi:hypothetical protein